MDVPLFLLVAAPLALAADFADLAEREEAAARALVRFAVPDRAALGAVGAGLAAPDAVGLAVEARIRRDRAAMVAELRAAEGEAGSGVGMPVPLAAPRDEAPRARNVNITAKYNDTDSGLQTRRTTRDRDHRMRLY